MVLCFVFIFYRHHRRLRRASEYEHEAIPALERPGSEGVSYNIHSFIEAQTHHDVATPTTPVPHRQTSFSSSRLSIHFDGTSLTVGETGLALLTSDSPSPAGALLQPYRLSALDGRREGEVSSNGHDAVLTDEATTQLPHPYTSTSSDGLSINSEHLTEVSAHQASHPSAPPNEGLLAYTGLPPSYSSHSIPLPPYHHSTPSSRPSLPLASPSSLPPPRIPPTPDEVKLE